MARKTRIGFIGTGGMGQCAHLGNYVALDTCEVVAICELKPKLRQRVAEKYHIAHQYDDHAKMLAEHQLDGLVVIQNFAMHGSILPPIYTYGLPIITEKPLASSVDVGQKLINAMADNSVTSYIGYHKRSDPATVEACKTISDWQASGRFGKMTFVRITMPPGDWIANGFSDVIFTDEPYPPIENDPKPVGMSDEAFGKLSAFVNYYIHQVNLMRLLMGEDYAVRYGDPHERVIVTESDSGVTGILETATFSTSVDWQEVALVCFEHAWVRIELPAPMAQNEPGRLTIFRDPTKAAAGEGGFMQPMLPMDHAMKQQARFFIEAIQGKQTPLCQPADALKDLEVAMAYRKLLES